MTKIVLKSCATLCQSQTRPRESGSSDLEYGTFSVNLAMQGSAVRFYRVIGTSYRFVRQLKRHLVSTSRTKGVKKCLYSRNFKITDTVAEILSQECFLLQYTKFSAKTSRLVALRFTK